MRNQLRGADGEKRNQDTGVFPDQNEEETQTSGLAFGERVQDEKGQAASNEQHCRARKDPSSQTGHGKTAKPNFYTCRQQQDKRKGYEPKP